MTQPALWDNKISQNFFLLLLAFASHALCVMLQPPEVTDDFCTHFKHFTPFILIYTIILYTLIEYTTQIEHFIVRVCFHMYLICYQLIGEMIVCQSLFFYLLVLPYMMLQWNIIWWCFITKILNTAVHHLHIYSPIWICLYCHEVVRYSVIICEEEK